MVAAVMLVGALASCTIDGQAVSSVQANSEQPGNVDTNQFDRLTLECQVLSTAQIAQAVGGIIARGTFSGAICRWIVDGPVAANVTFNWFEWGDYSVEKDTAKRLGYTTENIKVVSQSAFTQRDPKRPAVCGVTTRAPTRGVYTFWVEPVGTGGSADPCAAPVKLMELLLNGGQ
ncbi:MAG: DUF3558 domain-containing protein [Gordonia sp. (in: high G+C Gram-positive bacteria)]